MDRRCWTVKKPLTEKEQKEINEKNEKILTETNDIILTEKIENKKYNEDGSITITYEKKKHNLSKQINETAKLLKIEQNQKLQELLFGLTESNKE